MYVRLVELSHVGRKVEQGSGGKWSGGAEDGEVSGEEVKTVCVYKYADAFESPI